MPTDFGGKAFGIAGSRLWNNPPPDPRQLDLSYTDNRWRHILFGSGTI